MIPDDEAAQRVLKTAKSFNARGLRGGGGGERDRDTFGNRENDREGGPMARSQTEDPRRDTR